MSLYKQSIDFTIIKINDQLSEIGPGSTLTNKNISYLENIKIMKRLCESQSESAKCHMPYFCRNKDDIAILRPGVFIEKCYARWLDLSGIQAIRGKTNKEQLWEFELCYQLTELFQHSVNFWSREELPIIWVASLNSSNSPLNSTSSTE